MLSTYPSFADGWYRFDMRFCVILKVHVFVQAIRWKLRQIRETHEHGVNHRLEYS